MWRRASIVIGGIVTVVGLAWMLSLLLPPLVPRFALAAVPFRKVPRIAMTQRERVAIDKRLQDYFERERLAREGRRVPQAVRSSRIRLANIGKPFAAKPAGEPVIAGFYVNWDDNSLQSLKTHATDLDWVIGEWAFVPAICLMNSLGSDRRML